MVALYLCQRFDTEIDFKLCLCYVGEQDHFNENINSNEKDWMFCL